MNKVFIITLSLLSFCVAAVFFLFIRSKKPDTKNNFIRYFASQPVRISKSISLPHRSIYIAGISNSRIYLGDKVHPDQIFEISLDLSNESRLEMKFDTILLFTRPMLVVDSPNFYLMDGATRENLVGELHSCTTRKVDLQGLYFTNFTFISPSSCVLRTYSNDQNQYILVKKCSDLLIQNHPRDLLKKQQNDGIFSTEGMLHYDKWSSKIVYVYKYRNEYIGIDTNLNLDYTAKTIDTISHAQIKVISYGRGLITDFASPPLIVNKSSCVWKDKLFIGSGLVADNEEDEIFEQNTVVDVYSLTRQKYEFSFYVADFENEKMVDFKVQDKDLFVVFDHHLVKYELTF